MPAVAAQYRDEWRDAGVNIIGVSQFNTSEAATAGFVAQHGLTFPNVYDGTAALARAYGIEGVPSYVFLDKDGHIARRSAGARGTGLIADTLAELLTE